MSTLTIPNVFTNGTVINSSPFNANFGAITTWSTAIDNTNIGPAGFYANQLIPTTAAQATFGGTQPYTFPGALAITGALTGATTVNASGLITGVGVNVGGALTGATTGAFSGAVSVGSLTGPVTINSSGNNAIAGSTNGGTNKFDIFAGAISVAGVAATAFGFDDGTSNVLAVSKTTGNMGLLGTLSIGGATPGYVPPVYTAAGAATASTVHVVMGTFVCSSANVTITLSSAAGFSSQFSYVVSNLIWVTSTGVYQGVAPVNNNSSSSFTFQASGVDNTHTCTWYAFGT